jgi:hypothetical protein
MNTKNIGDRGQNCTIGWLAKYGIGVAFPLSDNYRFDLIAIANERLFKLQVKSSSCHENGSVSFRLATNNFRSGEVFLYNEKDCDVVACYDLRTDTLYLLAPTDFKDRKSIQIRIRGSKNGQSSRCHQHEDFVISRQRVKEVFDFEVPEFADFFAIGGDKEYTKRCKGCAQSFVTTFSRQKFCSDTCRDSARPRKVERPSMDVLRQLLVEEKQSMVSVGRKYGVSDNAVRKWLRKYGALDLLAS